MSYPAESFVEHTIDATSDTAKFGIRAAEPMGKILEETAKGVLEGKIADAAGRENKKLQKVFYQAAQVIFFEPRKQLTSS